MNPTCTATVVLSILAAALSAQAQYDLIHLGSAAGGYGLDIAVAGHYAFVASYTGGLRVYDISDPRNPTFIAATNSGLPFIYDRSITISGDYAYTGANRDTNFHVYNISVPTRPFPVANVFSGNYVAQIAVTGAIGYVANTAEGFSVYNFSIPSMPTRVTNFAGTSATCVTVQGEYAYVGSDHMFRIYSLTNPFAPVEVGKTPSLYTAAIAVSEGYAFVACPQVGVTLFDVRNPLSPLQVGPVLSIGRVYDALVSAHYLFVANFSDGVKMYDISTPSQPLEIAHVNTTGYAPASLALCLSGNYLFVASGNTGFYVCAIMPRLQVSLDAANVATISWPKPLAPGIIIEHTDNLSGGDWTPVNATPINTNGYCVLKTLLNGSAFFRLRISQ